MRLAVAALSLVATIAAAQTPATPANQMLVSTGWLADHLKDRSIVILHVAHDSMDFAAGHIPGARLLRYDAFTTTRDSVGTELPSVADLQRTFEELGVSDNTHVVIYASGLGMAPMASRAFLSLDYLGHRRVSLLDGGLARWRAENRPVTTAPPAILPGHLTPKPRRVTVDAKWVMAHRGKRGVALIDTRTTPEYLGTGERGGLRSDGHIEGARQLEWQQLFASADSAVFLEPALIRQLFAERSAPGDTIVTYCLVGYRASMTYFGARLAGLPVRIYDGSYQDWSRRKLPVKKGEAP